MENYNYNTELREIFTNTAGWVEKEKNQIVVINKAIEEYNSLYDALGDAKMERINSSSDGKYNFKQIKLNDIPLDIVLINEGVFLPMERYYKKQNFKQQARILLKKIQMMKQERGDFSAAVAAERAAAISGFGSLSSPASSPGASPGASSSTPSLLGSRTLGSAAATVGASTRALGASASAALSAIDTTTRTALGLETAEQKLARERTATLTRVGSATPLTLYETNLRTNIKDKDSAVAELKRIISSAVATAEKLQQAIYMENYLVGVLLPQAVNEAQTSGNFDSVYEIHDVIGQAKGLVAQITNASLREKQSAMQSGMRFLGTTFLFDDKDKLAFEIAKWTYKLEFLRAIPENRKTTKIRDDIRTLETGIAELQKRFSSAVGGGMDEEPYRSKYLKYKNKYLQLKRNLN